MSTLLQDVQSRVSDAVMRKERVVEETDPEYEKVKNYVIELEDHLSEAQRHAMRLVKRQRGIRVPFIFCHSLYFLETPVFKIYPHLREQVEGHV